jgi:hypothetical protein
VSLTHSRLRVKHYFYLLWKFPVAAASYVALSKTALSRYPHEISILLVRLGCSTVHNDLVMKADLIKSATSTGDRIPGMEDS